ncbi:N-acetyltransferase GCN5 [Polychaeton citri CBS 116435]|uniref:N-acetyltransferase GCN5 n=1 Tax=Polychaeton citri CBS 116435 TaxID=1314669 RepID=A0A9P4Q1E3_9PEZI|nr:N-acetyltransferase GCN5 [Polychaeton citri CBS 116435]
MQVNIRHATAADEARVADLWRTCNLVTSYNDPSSDFHFALSSPASTVLVAYFVSALQEDGESSIAGSVMVGHDGHRGWVYYVASSPDARGLGIGKRLVGAAEKWLKERGVRKCQLLVRKTNEGVVSFYETLGFETAPVVMMGKWLDGTTTIPP